MIIGHFVSFGIGGADRASINLIKALNASGIEQKIFYSSASIPGRTHDQDAKQKLVGIQAEYELLGLEMFYISKTEDLLHYKIDILHTQRSGDDEWLLPGLGKISRKFKIVETNFHGFLKTPADYRIYPSFALVNARKLALGANTSVIPNAINSPLNNQDLRKELNLTDEVVLGRVGRSDRSIYSKNFFKLYKKFNRNATILWLGASEQAQSDASSLGIQNIIWLNPTVDRERVTKIYNTFDIYMHVNRMGETFSNTVAEAMFHALPVVSIRGKRNYPQAQSELLEDPRQYTESRKIFVKNSINLIEDPILRNIIGERNQLRAEKFYSFSSVSQEVINVYVNVLST